MVSDRIAAAFEEEGTSFSHGITFAGHPLSCAVALASIDLIEREGLNERVRSLEGEFRSALESLLDLPLVAEVRGLGYFYALELGRGGSPLPEDERRWLVQEFLSRRLPELGLLCRTDDTAEPSIELAPALIAGPDEFQEVASMLRRALDEAWNRMESGDLRSPAAATGMPPATS